MRGQLFHLLSETINSDTNNLFRSSLVGRLCFSTRVCNNTAFAFDSSSLMDLHSSVFYPNRGLSVTGVANVGTVHVAEVDAAASPDGCVDSLSDREGQSKLEQKVQMENMSRSQAMFRVHSKI